MSGRTVAGYNGRRAGSFASCADEHVDSQGCADYAARETQADRELGIGRRAGGLALKRPSRRSSTQPSSCTIRW